MARVDDLAAYCAKHGLKMITIADLIAYRRRHDKLVERVVVDDAADRASATSRPSATARWSTTSTTSRWSRATSPARSDVLVRVHSECLTGDVFHSLRCDCGEQLESRAGDDRGRGPGRAALPRPGGPRHRPAQQARAYKLQEEGFDTVDANLKLGLPADLRDYGIGAQILVDLGLTSIRILTNNPKKIRGLEGYGLRSPTRCRSSTCPTRTTRRYLRTKARADGPHAPPPGPASTRRCSTRSASATREREGGELSRCRDRRRRVLRGPRRAPGGRRARRASTRPAPRASTSSTCPGAFELPLAAKLRARSPGATTASPASARSSAARPSHYDYVCGEAARGHHGRPAAHRRAVRVRRADRREHGPGARPLRRRQARQRPPRGRGRPRARATIRGGCSRATDPAHLRGSRS